MTNEQTTIIVTVYDVLGHKMLEQQHALVGGNNTFTTDFADFAKGVYLVKVTDLNSNDVQTKTIVK